MVASRKARVASQGLSGGVGPTPAAAELLSLDAAHTVWREQGEAGIAEEDGLGTVRTALTWASLPAMILALYMALVYAPTEIHQGVVQRIFYFHVPSAWVAFLSFFVVAVASGLFLWKRDRRYDIVAHSAAEVGVLFTTMVLVTGPFWGRPIWGAWWTWDARLTTTLVLWLIYVAYLMLRAYAGSVPQAATFSAVLGIIGVLDIPLIHLSVLWWRTLHPMPVVIRSGGPALAPGMLEALVVSLVAFTILYGALLLHRIQLGRLADEVERAKSWGG